MSQENIQIVRGIYGLAADFGGGLEPADVERQLSDTALAEYFDPEVEWIPVQQSLLASRSYTGYEGVRRFWTDFLSAWDQYDVVPVEFIDRGDQVAVTMRMTASTKGLEVDEVWSSLCTLRDGKIVRVQGFTNRDGALKAADLRY
jgi:ketosteroid isomerase-like protein